MVLQRKFRVLVSEEGEMDFWQIIQQVFTSARNSLFLSVSPIYSPYHQLSGMKTFMERCLTPSADRPSRLKTFVVKEKPEFVQGQEM